MASLLNSFSVVIIFLKKIIEYGRPKDPLGELWQPSTPSLWHLFLRLIIPLAFKTFALFPCITVSIKSSQRLSQEDWKTFFLAKSPLSSLASWKGNKSMKQWVAQEGLHSINTKKLEYKCDDCKSRPLQSFRQSEWALLKANRHPPGVQSSICYVDHEFHQFGPFHCSYEQSSLPLLQTKKMNQAGMSIIPTSLSSGNRKA